MTTVSLELCAWIGCGSFLIGLIAGICIVWRSATKAIDYGLKLQREARHG